MSTQDMNESEKAGIGCLMLFLLIIGAPLLIQLLQVVVVILIIGVVGMFIYFIREYDRKTGVITGVITRIFRLDESRNNQILDLPQKEAEFFELPEPKQEIEIKEVITDIYSSIQDIREDQERREQQRTEEIKVMLNDYTDRIVKKNKSDLLSDLFGNNEASYKQSDGYENQDTNFPKTSIRSNYNLSDEYEKQRFQESLRKKQEELDLRELRNSTAEQLFKQDVKIQEVKFETKNEVGRVREEMNNGFLVLQKALIDVQNNIMTLKGYVVEKFNQQEMTFFKEMINIKEDLGKFKADVNNQVMDVKLQFGKEILRLDQQQVRIVEKVASLHHTVNMFGTEMARLRNEFDRGHIRVEEMLNKASLSYEKQQVAIQAVSKDLNVGLQQMALYKMDFANEVGSATLKLNEISQDQYFALKDIGYERMGINMLRNEYDQRVVVEQTKMSNLIAEQRRVEERIQERISRGQETIQLQHQLHMTQENLNHTAHRVNLLRQEASVIHRQSK